MLANDLHTWGRTSSARIVALGEPTHGQREVNIARADIMTWFIRHRGVTTVALEAPDDSLEAARTFIAGQGGDAISAASAIAYYLYRTQEMATFLTELKAIGNISVIGVDVVDPGKVSWSERDASMARVTLKAAEEGPVVLWAHDGHITKSANWLWDPSETTMGMTLHRIRGQDYLAIGGLFGTGSTLAQKIRGDQAFGFHVFPFPDLVPHSSEFVIARHNPDAPAIIPMEDPRLDDCRGRTTFRSAGAGIIEGDDCVAPIELGPCYDAILWVPRAEAFTLLG